MSPSPRKRILQTTVETRSQTPSSVKNSRARIPQVFKPYKFYLDLKGKSPASLIEDIRSLGGQIEECLSKDVTHVITDAPLSQLPGSQSSTPGPPSPWTPTQTPSPATPSSAFDSERRQRAAPQSRAEAILSRVRSTSSRATAGSVLETATRLNCQIWALNKTLPWLAKAKVKYGGSLKKGQKSSEKVEQKRQLVAPCIKLESTDCNTRPVFLELKSWPVLRFDGRPGSSPFSTPTNSKQKVKKLAKRLDVDKEEQPTPKTHKKEEKQACAAASKRRTGGFCEICNVNYSELEKHLVTSQHQQFVGDQSNWSEVDQFCNFSTVF